MSGFFRRLIGNILLRSRRQKPVVYPKGVTFLGEDHLGNKYFENVSGAGKVSRTFESLDEEEWERIPVEWESWLRYKREAPTQEEIDRNIAYAKMVREKAAQLKAAEVEEKQRELGTATDMQDKQMGITTDVQDEQHQLSQVNIEEISKPHASGTNFPKYPDLEKFQQETEKSKERDFDKRHKW